MKCPVELMLAGPHTAVAVPAEIAVCPECSGSLRVRACAWDEETGLPHAAELEVNCVRERFDGVTRRWNHQWWQSEWQPVRDAITKWTGAFKT